MLRVFLRRHGLERPLAGICRHDNKRRQRPLYFACPDDSLEAAFSTRRTYSLSDGLAGEQIPLDPDTSSGNNYGYNSGAKLGVALAEVNDPAGTLAVVELPAAWNVMGNINGASCYAPGAADTGIGIRKEQGSGGVLIPFHTGGWNYAFADGHVKWMRLENTLSKLPTCGGNPTTLDNPCGMWTADDKD